MTVRTNPSLHHRALTPAVSETTMRAFVREAAIRGKSPDDLAKQCLDYIANDNLFGAVLDR